MHLEHLLSKHFEIEEAKFAEKQAQQVRAPQQTQPQTQVDDEAW